MKMKSAFSFDKGNTIRGWIDDEELEGGSPPNPANYWRTRMMWVRIEDMNFEHLEDTVNLFSKEGMKVDPLRQDAFENVMLTYLRKKLAMDEMIERTQHDIL